MSYPYDKLTPPEYQRLARRTQNKTLSNDKQLLNATLGLCGESGEFADHVKKSIFHNHILDKQHLSKELGDILWYICQACDVLGLNLEDVMEQNIKKLKERYPDGFSSERSRSRETDHERLEV